jgi:hypothetical protein
VLLLQIRLDGATRWGSRKFKRTPRILAGGRNACCWPGRQRSVDTFCRHTPKGIDVLDIVVLSSSLVVRSTSPSFFNTATMATYMTSLARYSTSCPFLHRTSTATLRSLATTPASHGAISSLTKAAVDGCPVMGPALIQKISARSYASVAGQKEVEEMHKVNSAPSILR